MHVACEVLVLSVVMFWVHKKTSNLWTQIEELTQRIEDQEEKIQNHERVLKQIIDLFNSENKRKETQSQMQAVKPKKSVRIEEHKKEKLSDSTKKAIDVLMASPLIDIEEEDTKEVHNDNDKDKEKKLELDVNNSLEDLDESIKVELAELELDNTSEKN